MKRKTSHVVQKSVRKQINHTWPPQTRRIPACVSTCARFRKGRTRASARCRSRRHTSRSFPTFWRFGTVSASSEAPSLGRTWASFSSWTSAFESVSRVYSIFASHGSAGSSRESWKSLKNIEDEPIRQNKFICQKLRKATLWHLNRFIDKRQSWLEDVTFHNLVRIDEFSK